MGEHARMHRRWSSAALSVALLLACETEQDRVRERVVSLADELPVVPGETQGERKRRIEQEVTPWLDPGFELSAPWAEAGTDRAFAIVAAIEMERLFALQSLDVGEPQVQLSPSGRRARVTGRARASASQVADLHGFDVPYVVDLAREGKVWRVVRLELQAPRQDLPEARP
jgi:hypothetical protein